VTRCRPASSPGAIAILFDAEDRTADVRAAEPITSNRTQLVGEVLEDHGKFGANIHYQGGGLRLPDLPSIAVLPFRNLRPDSIADYFANGIVDDIVVSLAGLPDLFVISLGSTLAYRGKEPDPGEVGRKLGVRYVVEGAVGRAGNRLRVSCELCDADFGRTIWAERAVVRLGDIFDLQENLVQRFVAPTRLKRLAAPQRLHGRCGTVSTRRRKRGWLALDPRSIEALIELGFALAARAGCDIAAAGTTAIGRDRG
jgi:TolB-like protein